MDCKSKIEILADVQIEILKKLTNELYNVDFNSNCNKTGQCLNIQKMIKEQINIINLLEDNGKFYDNSINKEEKVFASSNKESEQENKLDYFNNFKNCMVLDDNKLDDGVRILSCDFGIEDVYYTIGTYNKENNRRKVFINDKIIGKSSEKVDKIYNLFYDNECEYLLCELKDIGRPFYDMLINKGLTIIDNKFLNICDDKCINNLKNEHDYLRKKSAIVPFDTTIQIRNNMYGSLNNNLNEYNLFLQNDECTDKIYNLLKDSEIQTFGSNINFNIYEKHIQFKVSKNFDIEDFYNLCMFNYFCDKLKDYYENDSNTVIDETDINFKLLIGERGSGITSTLLAEAQMVGGTYISPSKNSIKNIKKIHKEFDYNRIKMISYEDLKCNDPKDILFIDLIFVQTNVTINKIKKELKRIGVHNLNMISTVGVGINTWFENLFPYLKARNKIVLRENNKVGEIIDIKLPDNLNHFNTNPINITILFEDKKVEVISIIKNIHKSCEECLEERFKQIGNKKFKDTLD